MPTRHLRIAVAATGFVVWLNVPHAAEQGAGGVAVMRDVMVPMRDGVRLATDIYLPTRDGAVVARSPADDPRTHAVQQDGQRA